jgi:hypothetical protein
LATWLRQAKHLLVAAVSVSLAHSTQASYMAHDLPYLLVQVMQVSTSPGVSIMDRGQRLQGWLGSAKQLVHLRAVHQQQGEQTTLSERWQTQLLSSAAALM